MPAEAPVPDVRIKASVSRDPKVADTGLIGFRIWWPGWGEGLGFRVRFVGLDFNFGWKIQFSGLGLVFGVDVWDSFFRVGYIPVAEVGVGSEYVGHDRGAPTPNPEPEYVQ